MNNKGGESWWIDLHGTCELEQRVSNIALPQAQLKATSPTRQPLAPSVLDDRTPTKIMNNELHTENIKTKFENF